MHGQSLGVLEDLIFMINKMFEQLKAAVTDGR